MERYCPTCDRLQRDLRAPERPDLRPDEERRIDLVRVEKRAHDLLHAR